MFFWTLVAIAAIAYMAVAYFVGYMVGAAGYRSASRPGFWIRTIIAGLIWPLTLLHDWWQMRR